MASTKTKKIVLALFLVSGCLMLLVGGYFVQGMSKVIVNPNTEILAQPQFNTPTPTPDPLSSYNVLLMGYGGPSHDGGYLTDTIIVANINPRDKHIALISIPRDVWVLLPTSKVEGEFNKLNHAYAIGLDDSKYNNKDTKYQGESGAGELAKYGAEIVIGMPIRHFAAISFEGFKNGIDILGGVNVQVPVTFTDKYYPIEGEEDNDCGKPEDEIKNLTATLSGYLLEQSFECRYETLHFEAGKQYMDAQTALKFVRSRHSEEHGGDFARSQRQKALILGIKEKVLSLNLIPKIIPLYNELTKSLRTDVGLATIRDSLKTHGNLSEYTISSIALTDAENNVLKADISSDGQFILIPKNGNNEWEEVHEYISNNINNSK